MRLAITRTTTPLIRRSRKLGAGAWRGGQSAQRNTVVVVI